MIPRPPELNATSRLFIRLLDATSGLAPWRAALVSVAAAVTATAAQWAIGGEVNLGVLFLVVCAFGVWSMGEAAGLALSAGMAVALGVVRHAQMVQGVYLHPVSFGAEAWNLIGRILTFGLIGVVVTGLRTALALERWHGSTDSLTGVLNKGAFEGAVDRAVAKARAHGRSLVLAYMDLDGFKSVNDQHGHSAGDCVLRRFATGAAQSIRATDLYARIGGDDFVALLTVDSCEDGDRVAELLHQRLTGILATTGFPVTCSMGALVMSGRDAALDDGVMERADALMYEVKRTGKNGFRVVRGGTVGALLAAAYRPAEDAMLDDLVHRIDVVDRAHGRLTRRAA